MSEALPHTLEALLGSLRTAGAAHRDAVGWHYIEVLAERARTHTGVTRQLLHDKLERALHDQQARLDSAAPPAPLADTAGPSPLAVLLRDMAGQTPASAAATTAAAPSAGWRGESPHVRQFRKQLRKISVQKQVTQAIAQAPLNAGPINSHMLVLRALGLMQDISPDYLNRFMTHLDTLLCLEDAEKARLQAPKSRAAGKPRKP